MFFACPISKFSYFVLLFRCIKDLIASDIIIIIIQFNIGVETGSAVNLDLCFQFRTPSGKESKIENISPESDWNLLFLYLFGYLLICSLGSSFLILNSTNCVTLRNLPFRSFFKIGKMRRKTCNCWSRAAKSCPFCLKTCRKTSHYMTLSMAVIGACLLLAIMVYGIFSPSWPSHFW